MRSLAACLVALGALASASAAPAAPPAGFNETTAFEDLVIPTVVRFAPDGRVFVAEKSGLVKVFEDSSDTEPDVYADLRTNTFNYSDRGLLGMTLDPDFENNPYVYVAYTHDAEIGDTAPLYGQPGEDFDSCPSGSFECVVSGRISRIEPDGDEQVLVEDYCQQYLSHSVGSLEHDASGALWASGGDGASFDFVDYGQAGNPPNPCGDPANEGGALRSQDLRTTGDPTSLDGTLIRIDDVTGAGAAGNPLAGSSNPNRRRIVAQGMRNPFRFAISRQGEVYVGDVGWSTWEEINRLQVGAPAVANFGWPCYEGAPGLSTPQEGYASAALPICTSLYASPAAVTAPFWAYDHGEQVGEGCSTGSSSLSGMEFYDGGPFPDGYDDALFFADFSRSCIWVMRAGADGRPDPSTVETFVPGAANPVFLESGPDGALYYADVGGGTIQRIEFTDAPVAVATADPSSGPAPLTVDFDGGDSSDPNGDSLDYAWDLDGDGELDDSTEESPSHTYGEPETVTVTLEVTDESGASARDTVDISAGNSPPEPKINSPTASLRWSVKQQVSFSGSANDQQDGNLPPSALDWDLFLNHCPSNCHQHPLQSWDNRASGSFTAPDHEYPSHLELHLTATDSHGLEKTTTMRLDPSTVSVKLASNREHVELTLNGATRPAPFTTAVIKGSQNTISAPSPQFHNNSKYEFRSWSDGGAATHLIVANATRTYTARMRIWRWSRDFSPRGVRASQRGNHRSVRHRHRHRRRS